MGNFKTNILHFIILVLASTACSSEEEPVVADNTRKDIQLTVDEMNVCKSLEAFNMELFKATCNNTKPQDNILLSPLSVAMNISMQANYVEEETASRICSALGSTDIQNLNSLNSKLVNELVKLDMSATLNLSNSLWYDKSYSLKGNLADILKKTYNAEIYSCNTSKQSTYTSIHDWVYKKSEGNIDYTPDAFASLLVNVLYFKGAWKKDFLEKNTQKYTFNGRDYNSTVMMMYTDVNAEFADGENFVACRKPFGNEAFSCIFVLPNDEVDIDSFTQSLTDNQLSSLNFILDKTNLYVPRFEVRSKIDNLDPILEEMGLGKIKGNAFANGNNTEENMLHETYVKLDEKGAVVAATTTVWNTGDAPRPPRVFKLDRPFLFFITEQSTGVCILAGKIVNL